MTIILSIDSGLEKTGYGIFKIDSSAKNGFYYIASGLIKTEKNLSIELRIEVVCRQLLDIIAKYKPEAAVFEQLFFFKNQKTAVAISQVQGATMYIAAINNLKVSFLTPLQIKNIVTGYGKADKKSVEKMIRLILSEDIKIDDDDQSDAIACGLAYCYIKKSSI